MPLSFRDLLRSAVPVGTGCSRAATRLLLRPRRRSFPSISRYICTSLRCRSGGGAHVYGPRFFFGVFTGILQTSLAPFLTFRGLHEGHWMCSEPNGAQIPMGKRMQDASTLVRVCHSLIALLCRPEAIRIKQISPMNFRMIISQCTRSVLQRFHEVHTSSASSSPKGTCATQGSRNIIPNH